MVALKKDGFSANSTDETELQQAKQDLIDQKPLIQLTSSIRCVTR